MAENAEEFMFKKPQQPNSVAGCSKDDDAFKKSEIPQPLVYTEPEWGGLPPVDSYSFEVIKQGTIISNIEVKKSFLVIGRLMNCDITVEHPSCSRYHAILQYCHKGSVYPEGLYIYDLGSTHGTFVNKEQIKSKVYYRLRTGHVMKFGGSTRLYVMQSPEKEEEEMTVDVADEPESCSWGIGEDAEEEDLTENPFALSTENEELFIDDPKKTLRDWFEREGFDLQYNVEEKGYKTFVCQVKLPIDNPSGEDYVLVEASVCGKKKEVVVACALEACRVLDRNGLLRQAQKESRKRKRKNWEDDDFYDSDEDTFLDRTGTIEKKREFRKKLLNCSEPETFDSLVRKIDNIVKEILGIEEKLSKSKSIVSSKNSDEMDPLDSYMTALGNSENVCLDAITKSKLRQRLGELVNEKKKLEKMRDIAYTPGVHKHNMCSEKLEFMETNVKKDTHEETENDETRIRKIDEDKIQKKNTQCIPFPKVSEKCNAVCSGELPLKQEKNKQNFQPPRKMVSPAEKANVVHKNTDHEEREQQCHTAIPKELHNSQVSKPFSGDKNEAEFSMWMPPANQSGDGTTHLNAKYGY